MGESSSQTIFLILGSCVQIAPGAFTNQAVTSSQILTIIANVSKMSPWSAVAVFVLSHEVDGIAG